MKRLIAVGTMGPKLKNRFAYEAIEPRDRLDTALRRVALFLIVLAAVLGAIVVFVQLDHAVSKGKITWNFTQN